MQTYKYTLLILTILWLGALTDSSTNATEIYAEKAGVACEICHLDPTGGGELTETGQGFQLSVAPATEQDQQQRGPLSRAIKLIFLYLHITTAFLWFGTILYVHLVLKPAYASQGLPGGEVKVGIFSILVMAISGAVLTYYKIPSFNLLWSSNFGLILLAKIIIFSIMVSSAIFVVLVIGPRLRKKKILPPVMTGSLTIDELAAFDGEAGRPAYFAYQGKIYDVSSSKLWKNGSHMKRHQAGVDLSAILSQAPHDADKILKMPEVGLLSARRSKPSGDWHKKVFYFMAYMNLGFVFVITLLLALWRW